MSCYYWRPFKLFVNCFGGTVMWPRPSVSCWIFVTAACISCLVSSQAAWPQAPPASNDQVQLVVKTGFPNFSGGEGLFSPDGRFAVVHGSGIVILFDLRLHYEVRRIALTSRSGTELFPSPANQQLAFSNHADALYVVGGERILKCNVLDDSPCSSIVDDAASGMAISADDKLAYI